MSSRREPTLYALLIGVRYQYTNADGVPSLRSSHRDVERMKTYLMNKCGYPEANIKVLIDDRPLQQPDPHKRLPTRKNIVDALYTLIRNAMKGDRLFFYFTGHGVQLISRAGTEDDGLDEGLLPCDHNGEPIDNQHMPLDPGNLPLKDQTARDKVKAVIRDNDLRKILVDNLPEGVRLMAIFDCCHSGTMLDLDHYLCNSLWFPWCVSHSDFAQPYQQLHTRRATRVSSARVFRSTRYNSGISPSVRDGIGPQRGSTMPLPGSHGLDSLTTNRTTSPRFFPRDENSGLIAKRCASPEPEPGSCYDGFIHCSENPLSRRHNGGDVLCLSFSSDAQVTWETPNKWETMTSTMLDVLDEHPDGITMKDLALKIGHSMYQKLLNLQGTWTKAQGDDEKDHFLKGTPAPFQTPQWGSMRPLDLDQNFLI